mmetsp:Transcript_86844/g.232758  ORF Transcript_86844/g.232758 Transcript_86844/m.232758 type:complete len:509 (-) Transcript_86844:1269-2795(-)
MAVVFTSRATSRSPVRRSKCSAQPCSWPWSSSTRLRSGPSPEGPLSVEPSGIECTASSRAATRELRESGGRLQSCAPGVDGAIEVTPQSSLSSHLSEAPPSPHVDTRDALVGTSPGLRGSMLSNLDSSSSTLLPNLSSWSWPTPCSSAVNRVETVWSSCFRSSDLPPFGARAESRAPSFPSNSRNKSSTSDSRISFSALEASTEDSSVAMRLSNESLRSVFSFKDPRRSSTLRRAPSISSKRASFTAPVCLTSASSKVNRSARLSTLWSSSLGVTLPALSATSAVTSCTCCSMVSITDNRFSRCSFCSSRACIFFCTAASICSSDRSHSALRSDPSIIVVEALFIALLVGVSPSSASDSTSCGPLSSSATVRARAILDLAPLLSDPSASSLSLVLSGSDCLSTTSDFFCRESPASPGCSASLVAASLASATLSSSFILASICSRLLASLLIASCKSVKVLCQSAGGASCSFTPSRSPGTSSPPAAAPSPPWSSPSAAAGLGLGLPLLS